ncbi:MAG TPA: hypothetical protein DD409_12245 [Bacteroidales bacterium]|nr:hypothetical protein [Bacteroidales bacterium]
MFNGLIIICSIHQQTESPLQISHGTNIFTDNPTIHKFKWLIVICIIQRPFNYLADGRMAH